MARHLKASYEEKIRLIMGKYNELFKALEQKASKSEVSSLRPPEEDGEKEDDGKKQIDTTKAFNILGLSRKERNAIKPISSQPSFNVNTPQSLDKSRVILCNFRLE